MYITHTVHTVVSLPCYHPSTKNPSNHVGIVCICIIYKAYYNLAMFPWLDYATPATVQTQDNNIKFILPYCSQDVFTVSSQLHSGAGMSSHS